MTFLPIIAFILFWAVTYRPSSIRSSFLTASLIWGACVTLSTELLSLPSMLTASGLSVFWLVMIAGALMFLFKIKPTPSFSFPTPSQPWSPIDITLAGAVVLVVVAAAITAFIAPPNNWDSMTYHMSRVAHWLQNKSVESYPTSMPRQLWASPWAEYAIAQFQILSHSDRFANMVQCWSMAGSIIGVSLIAQLLGVNRRGQLIAALLCATLPVGILEASSTQNDYTAAFWCVCMIYFGLRLMETPRLQTAVWCAISLGLALSTKNTSALFLLPFMIWITSVGLLRHRQKFLPVLAMLVCVPLLLNGPQYLRNLKLDDNIFSLRSESKSVTNEHRDIQAVVSNALRYLGLNLCTANEKLNQQIADTIITIHKGLGWNVIDPRYTLGEEYKIKEDIHEDNSCNTMFTLLFLFLMTAFAVSWHKTHHPNTKFYLAALAAAFTLFCWSVKWQPWGNRLLLPLFVLATPFAGVVLYKKYPRLSVIITIGMTVLCLPWILNNRSRPWIGKEFTIFNKSRNEQYFSNNPGMFFSYDRAAQEASQSGCKNIALVMTAESWEYPLWPLLDLPKNKDLRIEHVNINNPSKKFDYPRGPFDPCLAIHDVAQGIATISINGVGYVKTNQFTYLSIYRKDPDGSMTKSIRSSNLKQMIQYALASDQILNEANNKGEMTQAVLLESFRLRRLAVDYAGLLDLKELDSAYKNLGSSIENLLVKGSTLFLEGLPVQDEDKISQGQELLNQWNLWLTSNLKSLQTIFQ